MREEFVRTELLLGSSAMEKLKNSTVAIFGVGGVGSYVAEAVARSGVGHIVLIDGDTVSVSNINRQIIALHSTVGLEKTEVMRERILDINPDAVVEAHHIFYTAENADSIDMTGWSYIVDAIDTVSSKLLLIERAQQRNIPIISSMGAGNKLDPTQFELADIYKTSVCPLARVMRQELKKRGVKSLAVVYSREQPIDPSKNGVVLPESDVNQQRRQTPGSTAFVPSAAGLIIASKILLELCG